MNNQNDFYKVIENRRTIHHTSSEAVISEERLQEVINHAVKHAPSPFNSQSARIVVLTGEHHTKLWNITADIVRNVVPADQLERTEGRMNAFGNGYGTVLFFEDYNVVESLQKRYPQYEESCPIWSHQASGMLQYMIWTALEVEGFGASIQHYNPHIDDKVKNEWKLPNNWRLIAQMPFGKPAATARIKEIQPIEERVKFFH